MAIADRRPLLLANARLVDPATGRDEIGGLLIEGGLIRDLGPGLVADVVSEGTEMRDCGGAVLAPGLIDMRTFVGEPGQEYRETFRSASEAAAAGGVTTMITMPNTAPAVDDPAIVDFVLRRARDTALTRVHPAAALTKGCAGQEMTEIGLLSAAGAVAFTDGKHAVRDAQVMRRALTYARMFDALVIHHVEEPRLVGEGVVNEGEFATRLGLPGIPREAETIMFERDVRLVRLTGGRYHAAMLSCADSLDILRRAKAAGLPVTAGVSINTLTLNETDIGHYRTYLKLSPPLRSEDERLAMVEALAEGLIDVMVADHDPQDVETKRQPFVECANGAIGLETMLAAGLRLVHDGRVSLHRLLHALSTRPAELLGLQGGRLKQGAPADLVLFDPDLPWVVELEKLKSLCKNSPFEAARFSGKVLTTIVAGRVVTDYR